MAKNEMLLVSKDSVEELMARLRGIFSSFEDPDSLLSNDLSAAEMVSLYGKFLGLLESLVVLDLIEADEYRYITSHFSQLYQQALSSYCKRSIS